MKEKKILEQIYTSLLIQIYIYIYIYIYIVKWGKEEPQKNLG